MKTELRAREETKFPSGLVISHHTPFGERYSAFHHQIFPAPCPNEARCWMRDKMEIILDKDMALLISQTQKRTGAPERITELVR